jgi:hypothetical protein
MPVDPLRDEFTDCLSGKTCPHVVVDKCPWCNTHMFTGIIFDFSHGRFRCGCGYLVTPTLVKKK